MAEITPVAPAAIPAPAAPSAPKLSDTRPTTTAPPVKTADVNVDPEDLGKWAGLRRQLRETTSKLNEANSKASEFEKKIAEFDQLRPLADKHGAVERLVKEGKLVDAMKAAGVELEAAFAQWVEESEGKQSAATVPPQELLDLKTKYEAIEARLKAEDDAKVKADEESKVKADEAGRAEVTKGLTDKIAGNTARWARCAKEPDAAAQDALGVAVEKVRALKRAVTDEEAAELFDLALDEVEAEYKALAEKFYIPERPRSATVPQIRDYLPARDSSPVAERKVAVTLDGQRGSLRTPKEQETRGKLTADQAKAKALANIRALSQGR